LGAQPFLVVTRDVYVSIATPGVIDSTVELHSDFSKSVDRRIVHRRDESKQARQS
jgi:hypothetical protein